VTRLNIQKSQVELRLTRYHPTHLMQSLKDKLSQYLGRLNKLNLIDRSHQYLSLHEKTQQADDYMDQIEKIMLMKIQKLNQRVESSYGGLSAMNPRSVLSRGYSILSSQSKIIHSLQSLHSLPHGSTLEVEFSDGVSNELYFKGDKK